jgi:prepilin peptidase CpaA
MELVLTGNMLVVSFLIGTCAVLLLMASLNDIALRLLPNWTTLGVATIGITLRLMEGNALTGFAAASALFAVSWLCWLRGWMGGGDVKLLAACALLVPPAHVLSLLVLTALGGGVLALAYLLLAGMLMHLPSGLRPATQPRARTFITRLWRLECRRILRHGPLPYGCAISGAALILLLGPTGPLGN